MIVKFFCCDRCGQVVEGEKPYSIQAFKKNEPDGDFVLCWPCYNTLTDYLNEECTSGGLPNGLRVMNDFLESFNNRFVIGDE